MPRIARLVVPNYPYHVTQRGNYQQKVFRAEPDYRRYITLLNKYLKEYLLSVLSFCLMPNHVHFICVPNNENSLANTFKITHMLYSQYFNKKENLKGHLWQGRFFSSILDDRYLCAAVRYVENNPVRAGLVKEPWDWAWSSARAHVKEEDCGVPLADITQFMEVTDWKEYLMSPEDKTFINTMKKNTLAGKPSGSFDFIEKLEKISKIKLTPQKRGRPWKK